MTLVLRLLGRFDLVTGSGVPLAIRGTRAQLLLARLARAPAAGFDRGVLSAMLWGDRAEAQSRASLRQAVWTIRQALESHPQALQTDGATLRRTLQRCVPTWRSSSIWRAGGLRASICSYRMGRSIVARGSRAPEGLGPKMEERCPVRGADIFVRRLPRPA